MSKGDQTRQRIVAQAASLFNRRGYEGASMSELMKATGLEKGGIYRHFSSKEELAVEAFDYAWHHAMELRMRDLDSVTNKIDALKLFISNFIELHPPIPGGCPLLNTAIDADDGNLVLRQRARKALRGWHKELAQFVTDGIRRKEIKRGTDPEQVATAIISSLEGALMISRLEGNKKALCDVQSYLGTYLDSQVAGHA
jgi:TetR/AcrR family transcriptional regulator, transcriptional repressor for nem operon